jgi:HAD superfamily hydrolase (TIGR01509 family)
LFAPSRVVAHARENREVSELRAILFDFDGTVAETERFGHRVAYNEAFADLGLSERYDEETYGEFLAIAGGRERLEAFFTRVRPFLDPTARAALARRVHDAKRRRFDAIAPTLAPRPGIERIVAEALACGIRVAIATTAALDGVTAFVRARPALADAFATIVAGDDVIEKKPAPEAYRLALERLGVSASNAIAIEDSAIGLRAARAAGIATVVTPSGYTEGEDFSGAAAVLSDLGEPDDPARVLAGIAPEGRYANVAYFRSLLATGEESRD